MKKKKMVKDMVGLSVGASLMPTFFNTVDQADMGSYGSATKAAASGGFALRVAKKFKL